LHVYKGMMWTPAGTSVAYAFAVLSIAVPIVVCSMLSWSRRARIFAIALVTALWAATLTILQGGLVLDWLPTRLEAAAFYPLAATLIIVLVWMADRSKSQPPTSQPPTSQPPTSPPAGEPAHRRAVVALVAIAILLCCPCAFVGEDPLELRLDPDDVVILPLPGDLSLISSDKGCGSDFCGTSYEIGSRDGAPADVLVERLSRHLTEHRGWARTPKSPGDRVCRDMGWFGPTKVCLELKPGGPGPTISVYLGALE
jgi:hypothetical protein